MHLNGRQSFLGGIRQFTNPQNGLLMARLGVQFNRNALRTTSLAVWAHVVPANTMRHSLLLGRDCFMRFTSRTTYTVLSPRPPHNDVLGEETLQNHDIYGTAAFLPDSAASSGQFWLRFAGSKANPSRTRTFLRSTLLAQMVLLRWPEGISWTRCPTWHPLRNRSSHAGATPYCLRVWPSFSQAP